MSSSIDYFIEKRVNETLDIDDVGNTCIIAYNDNGLCYLLYTKTIMAETYILQVGPQKTEGCVIDTSEYSIQMYKMPYNKYKVEKAISTFLNALGRNITQASEVDLSSVREIFDINLFDMIEEIK